MMKNSPIVDSVGFVKRHPEMFFPGEPSAMPCLQHLAAEVLFLGVPDVTIERCGDWWIVWSSVDWFVHDKPAEDQMRSLIPLPEAGRNASRVEVVIVAFAQAVGD